MNSALLSIVVPAYNEEKRISKALSAIIDYFSLKALEKSSYMCSLPVCNMPYMPEGAEALGIWNPEELFLRQPIDFEKRVRVPKTSIFAHVSVHKARNLFPLGHEFAS